MKKSTRTITDPTLIVLKKLALPFISFLTKTPITPNQVTILNFTIFVPLASYLFFRGGVVNNLIGLGLIVGYSFFDLIDGELARQKNMQSASGHWFDISLDTILQTMIMFSIALNILMSGNEMWRLMALLPLFGQSIANVLGMRLTLNFGVDPFAGNIRLDDLFKKKQLVVDVLMKNMIVPTNFFFLTFFTLRFYMIVGIIFNILPFTFVLFGAFILFRSICIYLILTLHYGRPDLDIKYATLKYLRENTNEKN